MSFKGFWKVIQRYKKESLLFSLTLFVLGVIFSDFIQDNWNKWEKIHSPADISICPYNYPQVHDGKQWIRVNLYNNGLSDVNPIEVEYKLCDMDNFKRAVLHSNILRAGDSDFFEIQTSVDMDCPTFVKGGKVEIYADKKGRCYGRLIGIGGKMCGTCELKLKVFQNSKIIKTLDYPYPFYNSSVEIKGKVIDCLSYDDFENKSELIFIGDKNLNLRIFGREAACIRGEFNQTQCEQNGYKSLACA